MNRTILILALLIAVTFQSNAGFDLLWYKNIPNVMQINDVVFSNDSKWILCTAGGKPNLYIFDALTGELVNDTIKYGLDKPFFSPDDKKIIGIMNNKFYSYDWATGTLENRFDSVGIVNNYYQISQNKKYLLINSGFGYNIINFETGKLMKTKTNSDSEAVGNLEYLDKTNQIICTKGHQYLIGKDPKGNPIYENTRRINLYDYNTLDSVNNFYNKIVKNQVGIDYLKKIKMSHKQNRIALTFDNTDRIEIYEFPTMKLISKFNLSAAYSIVNIKFTSDDKYLIIAQRSAGDNLTQWEVETGKLINERKGGFNTLDLTDNDRYIGTSGSNMLAVFTIPTTDITNPKEYQEILYPNPSNGFVNIKVPILAELKISVNNDKGDLVLMPKFIQTDPNTISIDLNRLGNGIYFLNLTANNFNQTYKVIIIK
jgi:WD40 repeat protein